MSRETDDATTTTSEPTTKPSKSGLLFAVGMLAALGLLIALNMG